MLWILSTRDHTATPRNVTVASTVALNSDMARAALIEVFGDQAEDWIATYGWTRRPKGTPPGEHQPRHR